MNRNFLLVSLLVITSGTPIIAENNLQKQNAGIGAKLWLACKVHTPVIIAGGLMGAACACSALAGKNEHYLPSPEDYKFIYTCAGIGAVFSEIGSVFGAVYTYQKNTTKGNV